jgi:hypothetical protein
MRAQRISVFELMKQLGVEYPVLMAYLKDLDFERESAVSSGLDPETATAVREHHFRLALPGPSVSQPSPPPPPPAPPPVPRPPVSPPPAPAVVSRPVSVRDSKDQKMRVYVLAKELNLDTKTLLDYTRELGFTEIKTQLSALDPEQVEALKERVKKGPSPAAAKPPARKPPPLPTAMLTKVKTLPKAPSAPAAAAAASVSPAVQPVTAPVTPVAVPTPVPQPVPVAPTPAVKPPAVVEEGMPPFFHHDVFHRFPFPVALSYYRVYLDRDPRSRVEALVFAVEALLRYLACLGLADLFQCLARRGGEFKAEGELLFLRKPLNVTLGQWAAAVREVARRLTAEKDRVVRELPDVCAANGQFDTLLREVIDERNAWVHDPNMIPTTPQELKELFELVHPWFRRVLWRARFLRDYVLGYARPYGSPLFSKSAAGIQRFHSCAGNRVSVGADETFTATIGVRPNVPFVVTPDQSRVLYLWPLVAQRESVVTGRASLYLFARLTDSHLYLTGVDLAALDAKKDVWSSVLHPHGPKDFGWLLAEVKKNYLPQPVEPADELGLRLTRRSTASLVGQSVGDDGDYALTALLGAGGTGTVYKADAAGRSAAVKVLTAPDDDDLIGRFEREFSKIQQFAHRHVIRVFEIGAKHINGRPCLWYAMEYAAGGDLALRIERRRPAPGAPPPWTDPGLRAEIEDEFRAVASAVAHLHANEVIHRDVKPANVLVMEDDTLRLTDFGLVKSLEPTDYTRAAAPRTLTGVALGTEQYWAPEQARGGKEVEKPADVYALCVVLAELAAGHRPAHDLHVKTGSTLAGCSELEVLPPPLRDLILKGTDVSPAKRFRDARELLEEFERVMAAGH